ncbi:Lrp/AsnC family transcriptional regulator [Balneatrix alpica]|uniref:Lrp/AsnC family transcriptional regulator n=1 Tax=Balneatrix alpica TaxID=75684 RepID=UPI00273A2BD3|nr:Lrp/AsnC family transcriptional regulator [Balneatrix alpica]
MPSSKISKLNRQDQRILALLQQQGRISNQELAEQVQLSPSPCLRRVKRLEDEGIIEGYRALLNAKKLGLSLMAFIQISMDRHTPERFEAFESRIAQYPEVLECHLITGQSADYLLKVLVTDMEAYQVFLLNKITRIEGVSGVHSSFVMKTPIQQTALPLTHLS